MINDDILVKFAVDRIKSMDNPLTTEWVDYAKILYKQIRDIRDQDFTAIGLTDLTLKRYEPNSIVPGQRIILSDYLDGNCGSLEGPSATIIGRVNRVKGTAIELEIEGLGHNSDHIRDPERKLTWGTVIYPDMTNYRTYLEMISKPRPDGGNVYYFYNKSPRDNRGNLVPGDPLLSRSLILSSLNSMCTRYLSDTRERKRYFMYFNRIKKEIISLKLRDPILSSILKILRSYDVMSESGSRTICNKILWILKEKVNVVRKTSESRS